MNSAISVSNDLGPPAKKFKKINGNPSNINPMLVDEIIDLLLKKLPIEELKNCRQVCKLWDSRVTVILEKSWKCLKIIDFQHEREMSDFNDLTTNSMNKKIFSKFSTTFSEYERACTRDFFDQHQPKMLAISMYPDDSVYDKIQMENLLTLLSRASFYVQTLIFENISEIKQVPVVVPSPDPNGELQDLWAGLNFPLLNKLSITLEGSRKERESILQVFPKITRKSPNLKSLELFYAPTKVSIFNTIKDSGIINKIVELAITFSFDQDSTIVGGPSDLIQMQDEGLKLKSFTTGLNFLTIEKNIFSLQFELLQKFLRGQSDSLEKLSFHVGLEEFDKFESNINRHCRITLPNFPKLKKFSLGNNQHYWPNNPYTQIDLTLQLPCVKEICLEFVEFTDWAALFKGSCDSVEVLIVKYYNSEKVDKSVDYSAFEKFFPNVKKFRIDTIEGFKVKTYCPWQKTLQVVSFDINGCKLEAFDFKVFLDYKVLGRIELANITRIVTRFNKRNKTCVKLNLRSLTKLDNVKSLKFDKFLLDESTLKILRENYILDYIPKNVT